MVGWWLLKLVFAAALCAASVALARTSATSLDVELAIDTTGPIGPSIARVQRNAEKLVTSIQASREP